MKPFKSAKYWVFVIVGALLAFVGAIFAKIGFDALDKALSTMTEADMNLLYAFFAMAILALPVLVQLCLTYPTYFLLVRGEKSAKARRDTFVQVIIAAISVLVLILFVLIVLLISTSSALVDAFTYVYLMLVACMVAMLLVGIMYLVTFLILNGKSKKV